MSKFQVAYIPIGVPTFHLESAQNQFKKSVELLKVLTSDGVYSSTRVSDSWKHVKDGDL